jgi:putative tryptophan/tyrosine transport system substrate-binding protein
LKRRDFIAVLGGAAAWWPRVARAQQPAMPVIGFLSALSRPQAEPHLDMFRRGLGEAGFAEGRNVAIEYRWAEGQYDRLPAMAAQFVGRPVNLIVAQSPPAALAAKAATSTIPIVFGVGLDPVAAGLVASFNRPGGNATGIVMLPGPLVQKRLELIRELVPKSADAVLLVNPGSPEAAAEVRDILAAAPANRLQVRVLNATTPAELDAAFVALTERRPDALLIGGDPFFFDQRQSIVAGVARLRLPTIYPFRQFPEAGGLISYGVNLVKPYREMGIYAGRILQGAKAADLPVMQPASLELVINLGAAKALGVDIPPILHARSDEVIE